MNYHGHDRRRRRRLERLVSALWAVVWRRWLAPGDKVIRVKGWRTALIETRAGARQTITPLFSVGPWKAR
jgi:hypothetical protein